MLPLERFDFGGGSDWYSSSKGSESGQGSIVKQTQLYGSEGLGCNDLFHSAEKFCEENTAEEEQQIQLFPEFGNLDDLYNICTPLQLSQEEITKLTSIQTESSELIELQKQNPRVSPSESLGILKNYRSNLRQMNCENIRASEYVTASTKESGRKLSTIAIIRLAAENFIQSCSQRAVDVSLLGHPFAASSLGLSAGESKDVELLQYLLASAEKVGQEQFGRARKLLEQCDKLSSRKVNPVERLVCYFSEALRERIDQDTGRIASKGLGKKHVSDLEGILASPSLIAFHREAPFSQICQFTGMHVIAENVKEAKKVHIIDLGIRYGTQYTLLMQDLADRCQFPLEHLKITAVGTTSKPTIEKTGERLTSVARSLKLPFSFNVVMVAHMADLSEDLLELDTEEMVAVYSPFSLWTMIHVPERLESLMRVIKSTNPCVMVVFEVEANNNSPGFVTRFVETLFYCSALLDSMEDCMKCEDPNRTNWDSFFSPVIRNIVAAEGEERTMRHVSISVWREFFGRFDMVEVELGLSSLYQANLLVKNFASGSSCSLELDGECLIIGWKGTPIFSVSVWKFDRLVAK